MALVESTVVARRAAPTRARGFTLLELMMTLTVAGILLASASRASSTWSATTARDERQRASRRRSRSRAARRSGAAANVSVCRSSDGATCGASLADGWIVFRRQCGDRHGPSGRRPGPAQSGPRCPATRRSRRLRTAPRPTSRGSASGRAARFGRRARCPSAIDIELAGCTGLQCARVELNTVGRATVTREAC